MITCYAPFARLASIELKHKDYYEIPVDWLDAAENIEGE